MATIFWGSFGLTLLLLAGAAISGLRGARRLHFVLASSAITMLIVTIVLTEQLVAERAFPEREMKIHLYLAKTAAALMLAVAGTGIWTARRPAMRRLHRRIVVLFVVAALAATGTGIWVFGLSTPR